MTAAMETTMITTITMMTVTSITMTTTTMITTATILNTMNTTGTSLLRLRHTRWRSRTPTPIPTPNATHWYKDFRWGNEVKDEEGLPGFALINKATGLAIKHSLGAKHPVRLIPFNPEYIDESILWTESHDTGEGFRHIRMVNNIRLGFDAFHGDKDHGGVHDGTIVVLWEWLKGKNQRKERCDALLPVFSAAYRKKLQELLLQLFNGAYEGFVFPCLWFSF
ncbi:hypothetical protein KFK09_000933 [Dendrobium nobile]|uniref:Uncharacterized protein n=1 Tax=Dendrobium nobile TaxID=94219 RepID=A0A8T3CFB2_DENNO|nr:hypothetical protein KFK09_000933 [Dendrobium nobile]